MNTQKIRITREMYASLNPLYKAIVDVLKETTDKIDFVDDNIKRLPTKSTPA